MKKAAIALTLLILSSSASASIITVPVDQPTIQAGIDIALPGDTVFVEPGVYTGEGNRDLDLKGKKIRLGLSELGPLGVFLNCEGTESEPHRGFWIHSGEDSTAVIDGFTVFNAYAPEWDNAAVLIEGASPKLVNCVVENNVGNGVRVSGDTLYMYECVVQYNTGFGVRIDEAPAVITDCEITSNEFDGVFWRAQWYGYEFDMSGCLVLNNGGVGTSLMIGSGIFHVYNCTFVGNRTGFIYDWDFPVESDASSANLQDTSVVEDCIMAFNVEYGMVSHVWAGLVAVRCNDAFGNGIEDIQIVGGEPGQVYDNIFEDPLFCDPAAGDFTLYDNSPCQPNNNPCGALMGAFGTGCYCCMLRGDINHDGIFNPLDAVYFVDWLWRGGPEPPCLEEADVNGDGEVNPLDCLQLVNHFWRFGPPPVPCP